MSRNPVLWSSVVKAVTRKALISAPSTQTVANISSSEYHIPLPKQHGWNRAVAAAEKLVGFPTSALHLQALMTDDLTSMATHTQKIMASDHPILKTIKRLLHSDGKTMIQVRGLIVLLLARATATDAVKVMSDFDSKSGVLSSQRKLSEIVEILHSAQAIHRTVMNLPMELSEEDQQKEDLKEDLAQLEHGNKLAILGGDYLLATACTKLASLRNTYVTEKIAIAVAEFAQAEFIGKRDAGGRFLPEEASHLTEEAWILRNSLAHGSLLAKGCECLGLLGNFPAEMNDMLFRIGSNIALAMQAFSEVEPYAEGNYVSFNDGETIDLSTAPVIFHLRHDAEMLDFIRSCPRTVDLDSNRIYEAVKAGPGVGEAKTLANKLSANCLADIEKLNDGDAKTELIKLMTYIQTWTR